MSFYVKISLTVIMMLAFVVSAVSPVLALSGSDAKKLYRSSNDVIYFGDASCAANGGGSSTSVQLAGNGNVEKLLNYLQSKGLSLEQAAGVVGNAQWESGSLDIDPKGSDGVAEGIVQWQGGRLANLKKHGGAQYQEFDTQVQFIGVELGWEEPKNGAQGGTEAGALGPLKATSSPEEAALAWENKYERSADTVGSDGWKKRQEYARNVFEKYKNGGTGTNGIGSAATPLGATTTCSGGSTTGKVNADGYAWPIALNQAEVDGKWPCSGSCHHDGTPAFDLAKKAEDDSTEGTATIAIYTGTIQSFNNSYSSIPGCQAFQLVGDDGWWYWYGHQQASSVQNGSKVTAGQQISTVGRRACTGNGSYPHLHIDRGSPKGHYGGSVGSRDAGFVPLMNQLHDELGGGTPSAL